MKEYIKNFIKAGQIAKEVRAFGKALILPGASYNAIIAQIYRKIEELGATAAFPPQIALNEVAAHFLPKPGTDILLSTEVVKLDIGVCVKGAIGDCAVTVDLSGKYEKLIAAVEQALLNAESIIKVGLPIREIGKMIETTITSLGFQPIRNLGGHGLGKYQVHIDPSIPNCDHRSQAKVQSGMTFAIEPFATTGKGWIYESTEPTLFSLVNGKAAISGHLEVLVKKMKTFQGLPFSFHDMLCEKLSILETKLALDELLRRKIIEGYAPLLEEKRGIVAQAENSILVDQNGKVLVTTR